MSMITLRSYTNLAEAGLATSLLVSRGIQCELADVNANLYGGGPMAMPIRLLVAEEQTEKATRLLSETQEPLPDDFDPGEAISYPVVGAPLSISQEMEKLRRTNQLIACMLALLLALTVYLVNELPRRAVSPWNTVGQAMRQHDYKKALNLAQEITAEQPKDYYAHEYLGSIYFEMGDMVHAESEYTRAYELSPPLALQEKIRAVRKRRAKEEASPTESNPTP